MPVSRYSEILEKNWLSKSGLTIVLDRQVDEIIDIGVQGLYRPVNVNFLSLLSRGEGGVELSFLSERSFSKLLLTEDWVEERDRLTVAS
jgi:hypothetical protein